MSGINCNSIYIFDYLNDKYPEHKALAVGAMNCIIRKYENELHYLRGRNVPGAALYISTGSVMELLRKKADKELLSLRNFGKGKLEFMRKAQADYEKEHPRFRTKFNRIIDDWVRVKNHCRTTDNKDFTEKEPTEEFKRKLLISEHSPIRLIEIDWSWEDIYSWVATHWSRHKFEKFISTQRDDRKEHDIPRGEMPQNTPVKFDGYANMQSLIDSFRKRLCYQASPETRELAGDFKMALMETKPELAEVLMPNCVYRCSCPEFKTCGYFNRYLQYVEKWFENAGLSSRSSIGYYRDIYIALSDIQTRYSLYNKMFKEEF